MTYNAPVSCADLVSRFRLPKTNNGINQEETTNLESQSGLVQVSECLNIACRIIAHLVDWNVLRPSTDRTAACWSPCIERLRIARLVDKRADAWDCRTTAAGCRGELDAFTRVLRTGRRVDGSGTWKRRSKSRVVMVVGQSGIYRRDAMARCARRDIVERRPMGLMKLRKRRRMRVDRRELRVEM
jgi:hypothetical protein